MKLLYKKSLSEQRPFSYKLLEIEVKRTETQKLWRMKENEPNDHKTYSIKANE